MNQPQRNAGKLIERELVIAAPPSIVFAYLIDPARLVQWMGRVAQVDPRPGGVFRLDYNGSDIARGEFIEVIPNERVAFTWGWEAAGSLPRPGESVVEFTLTPRDDGTHLRMVHRDLSADEAAPHAEGWDYFLPRLATVATGGTLDVAEATIAANS